MTRMSGRYRVVAMAVIGGVISAAAGCTQAGHDFSRSETRNEATQERVKMSASRRLKELGLTLPPVTKPVGSYVPATRTGNLILVSGQIPFEAGKLTCLGKVGRDVTLEQAASAARLCALNGLAIAADLAGGIDRISKVVRLGVFVNSAAGFSDQPKVANGASDLMVDIFGEAGRHARAAVGAAELPLNAAVEVEMILECWAD